MSLKGLRMLNDVGRWTHNTNRKLTFSTTDNPAPQAKWSSKAREHWTKLTDILIKLDPNWLFDGDPKLMMTRAQRQSEAEEYIRGLPSTLSLPPSPLPHQNRMWGSDGSMIPATSGIGDDKSVTAAVTGPQTVVVRLHGRNLFILHGELIGLIMGLILSHNETLNNKLFTDHLNSVRFIDDARTSINQEN